MIVLAALAIAAHQNRVPVLWLRTTGDILVKGDVFKPEINPGVSAIKTSFGMAFDFNGSKSGILFGDQTALKLNGNITIAARVLPRTYAPNGSQSEILFRGDDRNGFDPFSLSIQADGQVKFDVQDDKGHDASVEAPLPLGRWSHVTASLDAKTGEMLLWIDGFKAATDTTSVRPFVELIPKYVPGVGVGNVQNNKGPHNQPFDGLISDLRLYSTVMLPTETGFFPSQTNGVEP